jgi:hypothetical protein
MSPGIGDTVLVAHWDGLLEVKLSALTLKLDVFQ